MRPLALVSVQKVKQGTTIALYNTIQYGICFCCHISLILVA